MNRVQLVVTGRCEREALHYSFQKLFNDVTFLTPVRVESFTSSPLVGPVPTGVVANLDKFALKLVQLVDEDDATLVVGVDDLELDQDPGRVTTEVRAAVERVVQGQIVSVSMAKRERLFEQVSKRCSFHICAPMIEAYFFGEQDALQRAGAVKPSRFDARGADVEDFIVEDQDFLGPPDSPEKSDWRRGGARRARHPKLYLKFLVDGPKSFYRETREGVAALRDLAWPEVLSEPRFARFARSLVADIADYFQTENAALGEEHPLTSRRTQRAVRILRNI